MERETERERERRYYDHDTIWQLEVSPDDTIDKQMIFSGHKISIADQILCIERQAAESDIEMHDTQTIQHYAINEDDISYS